MVFNQKLVIFDLDGTLFQGHLVTITLINDIIRELKAGEAVVAGDRIHDFEAARQNGLIAIGVTYGYGGDEVEQADFCADTVDQALGHILRCLRKI